MSNTLAIIVGVAPRDFHGVWPGFDPKLYFPLHYLIPVLDNSVVPDLSEFHCVSIFCDAIGRLKSGSSIRAANSEIEVRANDLLHTFLPPDLRRIPEFQSTKLKVESARTGLPTPFGRNYSAPLLLMQGLVAVVLLLCCVNVSGLMLSKIQERQREFAVRTAIGAARWRLIRQYLESFVSRPGRLARRRGCLVGDTPAAPVLPRPEFSVLACPGRAGQDGLPGDGSLRDHDDSCIRHSSRVARGPHGSGRAFEDADSGRAETRRRAGFVAIQIALSCYW